MKFRADNRIRYKHDRKHSRGIPAGVDFKVQSYGGGAFVLTRFGYGLIANSKRAYGGGPIYVYELTTEQCRRFERETEKKER